LNFPSLPRDLVAYLKAAKCVKHPILEAAVENGKGYLLNILLYTCNC